MRRTILAGAIVVFVASFAWVALATIPKSRCQPTARSCAEPYGPWAPVDDKKCPPVYTDDCGTKSCEKCFMVPPLTVWFCYEDVNDQHCIDNVPKNLSCGVRATADCGHHQVTYPPPNSQTVDVCACVGSEGEPTETPCKVRSC